jgi:hypothetical protein
MNLDLVYQQADRVHFLFPYHVEHTLDILSLSLYPLRTLWLIINEVLNADLVEVSLER